MLKNKAMAPVDALSVEKFKNESQGDDALALLDEEGIGRWLEASGEVAGDMSPLPDALEKREAVQPEGSGCTPQEGGACTASVVPAEERARIPGEGQVVRFRLHGNTMEVTEAEIAAFVERAGELERIVDSPEMKGLQQLARLIDEKPEILTAALAEAGKSGRGDSRSLYADEQGVNRADDAPTSDQEAFVARLWQGAYKEAEELFGARMAQLREELQAEMQEARRALSFDLARTQLLADPEYPRIVECIHKKLREDVADGHMHYEDAANMLKQLDSDPQTFSRAYAYFRRRLPEYAGSGTEGNRQTIAPALNGSSSSQSPHGARRNTVWNRALQGDTESIGSLWD